MQGQSTNQSSSRTTAGVRQYGCQRIFVSCPSALCILDLFVFLVCLRAPPAFRKTCSSFLTVLFTFPLLLLLPLPLPFPFVFVVACDFLVLAFALAGPPFALLVRARPFTCLVVLQEFGFLPTCNRKFHTMTSFFATF